MAITEVRLTTFDETVIPAGYYCYAKTVCPYWYRVPGKGETECGYCSFLSKGDWELNPVYNKTNRIVQSANTDHVGKTVSEIFGDDFPSSLLFDQCKECGINIPEDIQDEKIV